MTTIIKTSAIYLNWNLWSNPICCAWNESLLTQYFRIFFNWFEKKNWKTDFTENRKQKVNSSYLYSFFSNCGNNNFFFVFLLESINFELSGRLDPLGGFWRYSTRLPREKRQYVKMWNRIFSPPTKFDGIVFLLIRIVSCTGNWHICLFLASVSICTSRIQNSVYWNCFESHRIASSEK